MFEEVLFMFELANSWLMSSINYCFHLLFQNNISITSRSDQYFKIYIFWRPMQSNNILFSDNNRSSICFISSILDNKVQFGVVRIKHFVLLHHIRPTIAETGKNFVKPKKYQSWDHTWQPLQLSFQFSRFSII